MFHVKHYSHYVIKCNLIYVMRITENRQNNLFNNEKIHRRKKKKQL